MIPTVEDFTAAVLAMAELIPFFPQGEAAQLMIIAALQSFVQTTEQLNWLTTMAASHMRKWSCLADLRGIFCTRWEPGDGRHAHCDVPGFTMTDLEAEFFRRESEETSRRIEHWKREKLLAPPEYSAPFPLPQLKLIPKPEPKPLPAELPGTDASGAQHVLLLGPGGELGTDARPLAEVEREVLERMGPRRSQAETARLVQELEALVAQRQKKA